MDFMAKLRGAMQRHRSLLCIGLDPDPSRLPEGVSVPDFNRAIIDATADLVCAYKPQLAFYEALGEEGHRALRDTIKHIPDDIPIIADAKRNDIGNTAAAYARAIFDYLGCDAVTVNPYLGHDSLEPFLAYRERGVFILCRTSNPGSADFQELRCGFGRRSVPLYEIVARKAAEWNTAGNVGLVIGATFPQQLAAIRQQHPELPFLIPGVGAQGGDVGLAVRNGIDQRGEGIIINSARQVLYASSGPDFAAAARRVAAALRDEINRHRPPGLTPGP